jgi:hypothetical protein
MARLIPDKPAGMLPGEVLKVFRHLKTLPDSYIVWHHLVPWQKDAPDFLILNANHQVLLVKVSDSSLQEAQSAAQLLLKGVIPEKPPLGKQEETVLATFLSQANPNNELMLTAAILFPGIPEKLLHSHRPLGSLAHILWLGQEMLAPDTYNRWEVHFTSPVLDDIKLERLRRSFTPEVVVPYSLTIRQPIQRNLEAGITDFLLDYDQETALKSELELPDSAQNLSREYGINLVNGVAGSGKTLILLYRLRLLQAIYPKKRFLVLTHNRPLIKDLEARFYKLTQIQPKTVEWRTFLGWCRSIWPDKPAWKHPISETVRQELIYQTWQSNLPQTGITERMLHSEIDWIKDQMVDSLEVYLDSERRGRGFRLNQGQRERIYHAYQEYQERLQNQNWIDWADVPLEILHFIRTGELSIDPYDAILIDEAQFFAPAWFEIIRHSTKPIVGLIFLSADPTQGFLRQGTSWKSLGFDVRGRSFILRQSYRTTHEILNFATLFYRQRIGVDAEHDDIVVPDLFNMPTGIVPQIIPLTSSQDETTRVANEIVALVKRGIEKKDILVLHANYRGVKAVIQALESKLGRGATYDPEDQYPGNYIRVTTINRGTGLEAPIVFTLGLRQLFEEEQSLRLSDEEREQLILENTRKIYMAATRAGRSLILTYVGELPEVLRQMHRI